MSFKYTTAISKIRRMKARVKIIPGGTSAGKTYSIIPILIDKAIKNPLITISIVSESLPHLRKGAIKDFLQIMKGTNRYIDKNWNRTNLVYTFTNGSYIEFFSVEDEKRVRGPRRNILYLNEANLLREDTYTQLEIRTDGDIYIDYNPTHRFWADEILNCERLTLTYKDNEALSKNIIDSLEEKRIKALTSSYWANWCRVYLDGQIGRLEGVIFENWGIVDYLPEDAELVAYGADWGWKPDPTTIIGIYKYKGEIILDEVLYENTKTSTELAALMKDRGINGTLFCDNNHMIIQDLRNHGFSAYASEKGPGSIKYGIGLMQEYKLNITKRSLNLKNELENYKWAKDREGNDTGDPIKTFNHCIDAIRYVFMMRLKHKSSTPTQYF